MCIYIYIYICIYTYVDIDNSIDIDTDTGKWYGLPKMVGQAFRAALDAPVPEYDEYLLIHNTFTDTHDILLNYMSLEHIITTCVQTASKACWGLLLATERLRTTNILTLLLLLLLLLSLLL